MILVQNKMADALTIVQLTKVFENVHVQVDLSLDLIKGFAKISTNVSGTMAVVLTPVGIYQEVTNVYVPKVLDFKQITTRV